MASEYSGEFPPDDLERRLIGDLLKEGEEDSKQTERPGTAPPLGLQSALGPPLSPHPLAHNSWRHVEEVRMQQAKYEALQHELESLQNLLSAKEAELEQLQYAIKKLEKALAQFQQQVVVLTNQNASFIQESAPLRQKLVSLENELQKQKEEILKLRGLFKKAEKDLSQERGNVERLTETNTELGKTNKKLAKNKAVLFEQNKNLNSRLEQQEAALPQLGQQVKSLQELLKQKESLILQLTRVAERSKAQLSGTPNKNSVLEVAAPAEASEKPGKKNGKKPTKPGVLDSKEGPKENGQNNAKKQDGTLTYTYISNLALFLAACTLRALPNDFFSNAFLWLTFQKNTNLQENKPVTLTQNHPIFPFAPYAEYVEEQVSEVDTSNLSSTWSVQLPAADKIQETWGRGFNLVKQGSFAQAIFTHDILLKYNTLPQKFMRDLYAMRAWAFVNYADQAKDAGSLSFAIEAYESALKYVPQNDNQTIVEIYSGILDVMLRDQNLLSMFPIKQLQLLKKYLSQEQSLYVDLARFKFLHKLGREQPETQSSVDQMRLLYACEKTAKIFLKSYSDYTVYMLQKNFSKNPDIHDSVDHAKFFAERNAAVERDAQMLLKAAVTEMLREKKLIAAGKEYDDVKELFLLAIQHDLAEPVKWLLAIAKGKAGKAQDFNQIILKLELSDNSSSTVKKIEAPPLHYAAFMGHTNTIKVLLKAGIKINQKCRYGATPLHFAALGGKLGVLELLLKKGANIHEEDRFGQTAINWAKSFKSAENLEVTQWLEEKAHPGSGVSEEVMDDQYSQGKLLKKMGKFNAQQASDRDVNVVVGQETPGLSS